MSSNSDAAISSGYFLDIFPMQYDIYIPVPRITICSPSADCADSLASISNPSVRPAWKTIPKSGASFFKGNLQNLQVFFIRIDLQGRDREFFASNLLPQPIPDGIIKSLHIRNREAALRPLQTASELLVCIFPACSRLTVLMISENTIPLKEFILP